MSQQESGYQPYRTFLFIAYSGEGLEGGEPVVASDVHKFLQAHRGFVGNLEVEAIVHLRGLGGDAGQPTDTADALSAETLGEPGRALSLLLMALGRELQY